MQADIDMLPDFSESSKIVQVLEGIQPVSFRSMIHSKYPHIVSMADVKGAIAIIRGASQKEQKDRWQFKRENGKLSAQKSFPVKKNRR